MDLDALLKKQASKAGLSVKKLIDLGGSAALRMCAFRFGNCQYLAQWQLKSNATPSPPPPSSGEFWKGIAVITECSEISPYIGGCNFLSYNINSGDSAGIAFRESGESLNLRLDQQYGCIGVSTGISGQPGSSFSYSLASSSPYPEQPSSTITFNVESKTDSDMNGIFTILFELLRYNGKEGQGMAKGTWLVEKQTLPFPKCLLPIQPQGVPIGGVTPSFFCPSFGDYWCCDYKPVYDAARENDWGL